MGSKKFKNIDKKMLKYDESQRLESVKNTEPIYPSNQEPIYPFTSKVKLNDYKDLAKQRLELLKKEIDNSHGQTSDNKQQINQSILKKKKIEWIDKELLEVRRWYQSNTDAKYRNELDQYSNYLHVFKDKLNSL